MFKIISLIIVSFVLSGCKKEYSAGGSSSLISIVPVPPGADCPAGGIKIQTGIDVNHDKILEEAEITDSQNFV